MEDLKSTWGTVVAALIAISLAIPKILNMRKSDANEGTTLDRVGRLEKRASRHDRQIHIYAVNQTRLIMTQTRLVNVVSVMNRILKENNWEYPEWLQKEIEELTQGDAALVTELEKFDEELNNEKEK